MPSSPAGYPAGDARSSPTSQVEIVAAHPPVIS